MSNLTDTASKSFSPFSFPDLSNINTLSEMHNVSMHYYESKNHVAGTELQTACQQMIDWYVAKIDDNHFSETEHIIRGLNKSLNLIGCQPLNETGSGPHLNDKLRLRDHIVSRTIAEIVESRSGDLVDMHLKSMIRSMRHIGEKIGNESVAKIGDAIQEWQTNQLSALQANPTSPDHQTYGDMLQRWIGSFERTLNLCRSACTPPAAVVAAPIPLAA